MAGRGKYFELLDFPKFAYPSVVGMDQVLITATLVLSGTSSAGTPPIASKAPTRPLIQSASPCVQVACAKSFCNNICREQT